MKEYIVSRLNVYGRKDFTFANYKDAVEFINDRIKEAYDDYETNKWHKLLDVNAKAEGSEREQGYMHIEVYRPYGKTVIHDDYSLSVPW